MTPTTSPPTPAPDLIDRLRETAARLAGRVAVEAPDGVLTFDALERRSNQLAHRLASLGIGPEARVAVSLPRGAGELVTLLATLKAGGAYVPLDPAHPLDRLSAIVEDAAPDVMVVHPASPFAATGTGAGQKLVLGDLAREAAGWPESPLGRAAAPSQLAYVLFTSGSTGRPKGVEIVRGALANFLRSMAHTPGLGEADRLLAITTTSFDIAGLELFLPPWVGATVIIADRATAADARRLRRRLEMGDVTVLQATPATWRLLLEAGWSGDRRLKMLCGGEGLPPALADRLLAAGGELWNMYGPTETTIWSTLERIRPGDARITVGRPIDATTIHVLDDRLAPAPVGGEGEICIGGDGLARGYRGKPALTAERFVQGPGGERLYRTGDLGRLLPDGRLEHLGRLDHQVKIRGFRIELGEIETVLRTVPGVGEALVTAGAAADGEPRLVAYWVGPATAEALAAEAARKLPAYMIPSAWVPLPFFPLNTNGKIDRKQLPRPGEAAARADAAPARPPRDDRETLVASIWADVLGLPAVDVDRSFLSIGGTSAHALRVLARLEEATGVELPLQAFFEDPTVAGMAARLGGTFEADAPIAVTLRRADPGRPPLFCLFGVNLYQELAHALPPVQPVIGIHVPFLHDPEGEPPSLEQMATRYVRAIRALQPSGPYALLGLCFGGVAAYEVARLLEAEGETIALVAILDALLPTGIRVDPWQRLGAVTQRAMRGDLPLGAALMGKVRALAARLRPRRATGAVPGRARLVNFSVTGPEADEAVRLFSLRPRRVAAPLLVVRATAEPTPVGVTLDGHQGWRDWADRVEVLSLPTTHLEIVQPPHVQRLAAAIQALLAGGQAGNRSSVRSTSSGST